MPYLDQTGEHRQAYSYVREGDGVVAYEAGPVTQCSRCALTYTITAESVIPLGRNGLEQGQGATRREPTERGGRGQGDLDDLAYSLLP